MVMHLGDLCYNLHEEMGMKADRWMNFIQPVAGQIPYQTLPGNHEKYYNYTHYESRSVTRVVYNRKVLMTFQDIKMWLTLQTPIITASISVQYMFFLTTMISTFET